MLSTCLALAIDEGHLTSNPCKRVRLPTQQIGGAEARFLTHEEFALLIAAIPEHYRPLVVFLVGTGLRWSEATAIQTRHVDIRAGTVRVEQAWKRVPGGFKIGPPKTGKSKRTVNAAVMALAAVLPLLGKPSAFVFTTPAGQPVKHANFFTHIWKPACKRAGLDPAPRIHDLRHTHASWLISDGIQLEAVQDQLGHESILTTRKVYGHLLPALGVAVGLSASAALERALPNGWATVAAISPRTL
jgi:integrase